VEWSRGRLWEYSRRCLDQHPATRQHSHRSSCPIPPTGEVLNTASRILGPSARGERSRMTQTSASRFSSRMCEAPALRHGHVRSGTLGTAGLHPTHPFAGRIVKGRFGAGRAVANARLSDREGSNRAVRRTRSEWPIWHEVYPLGSNATVQHPILRWGAAMSSPHCNGATLDQAANSPGSGSSFNISRIGSPRTICAGRPLRVSRLTR